MIGIRVMRVMVVMVMMLVAGTTKDEREEGSVRSLTKKSHSCHKYERIHHSRNVLVLSILLNPTVLSCLI